MAETVPIGDTGHTAKVRHPVAVPALSVITIGIYFVYWWYQVNREVVDLGRARNVTGLGDNPTLSLLAMFPGALVIVPPYVSLYNGVKRFQRAQQATRGGSTLNGWIVLGLLVAAFVVPFATLIVPGYIQAELNKIGNRTRNPAWNRPRRRRQRRTPTSIGSRSSGNSGTPARSAPRSSRRRRRACCTIPPRARRPGSPDRTPRLPLWNRRAYVGKGLGKHRPG